MPGRPKRRERLTQKRRQQPVIFQTFQPLSVTPSGSSLEVRLMRWAGRLDATGGVTANVWALDVRRFAVGPTYSGPTWRGIAMTRAEFEGLVMQVDEIRTAFDAVEAQERAIEEDFRDA